MRKPISCVRSLSGLAPHGLDAVEQKVTAIEQRDREQIDQADAHDSTAVRLSSGTKPSAGHLPRNLGDADRAAQLVGRFAAHDHIAADNDSVREMMK